MTSIYDIYSKWFCPLCGVLAGYPDSEFACQGCGATVCTVADVATELGKHGVSFVLTQKWCGIDRSRWHTCTRLWQNICRPGHLPPTDDDNMSWWIAPNYLRTQWPYGPVAEQKACTPSIEELD